MKPGIVYTPYLMAEYTIESLVEHKEFMDIYNKLHNACPICGCITFVTTLISYPLNLNKKEEYKDKNICQCSDCGYEHLTHDRVPRKED